MSKVTLMINGESHTVDVPPDMPLLWALRDVLNLTGTNSGIKLAGLTRRKGIDHLYLPVILLAQILRRRYRRAGTLGGLHDQRVPE